MMGEIKALKSHNGQLTVLLFGKALPAEVKAKKQGYRTTVVVRLY
ncbi:hypothetical protein [Salmonella enterica]|nr:hypothetical protein [Salmonella enterica]